MIQDTCSIEWNDKTTHPSNFAANMCLLTADEQALSTVIDQLFHIDSGATSHCSPNRSDFSEINLIPTCLIGGINGTSIAAIGKGKMTIRCGKGRKLTLNGILYVPQASLYLISVGQLADDNILSSFDSDMCTLHQGFKIITNAH